MEDKRDSQKGSLTCLSHIAALDLLIFVAVAVSIWPAYIQIRAVKYGLREISQFRVYKTASLEHFSGSLQPQEQK